MSAPLPPRPPADPLAVPGAPLAPGGGRSRAALGLAAMAARGRFALQVCADCGAAQYPPRDVCRACLGPRLPWRDVPAGGQMLAVTTTRISAAPYFRRHAPWRTGLVGLDCGPSVVAHLHRDVSATDRVRMRLHLDKSGAGVMLALPEQDTPHMDADPILREFTADPRGRRVLVTDARTTFGQAVAGAMLAAGAEHVFAGIADAWKPITGTVPGDRVDLDMTDTTSVHRLAAALGGRIDIVIDTALHLRPGGLLERRDVVCARAEMEAGYFGRLRLAQALGPALQARAGDGTHGACAWVNILSIAALAPLPGYAVTAAAQAAALSLTHAMRAELRPLKIITAFVGPLDDEWHQTIPPPKVTPPQLATAVLHALRRGLEDIAVGDIAQDVMARWTDAPTTLARDLI